MKEALALRLKQRWLLILALLIGASVVHLCAERNLSQFGIIAYMLGLVNAGLVIASLHFFAATSSAMNIPLRFFFAVGLTFFTIANIMLGLEFGDYLSPYMIRFIADDPIYLWNYLETYLPGRHGVFFLFLAGLFYWLLGSKRNLRKFSLQNLILAFVTLALSLVLANQIRIAFKGKHLDLVTSTEVAFYRYAKKDWGSKRLQASQRKPLATLPTGVDRPNILIIVNESWDHTTLAKIQSSRSPMPNLTKLLPAMQVFQRASANSSATDVSVPSIFSGVNPSESYEKLHHIPLLWDWAKAAGYETYFISSQRLNWNNLDAFLFNSGLDHHFTALDLDAPIVNDMGIDDMVSATKIAQIIKTYSGSKPIMIVFNSNSLHIPFQQTSSFVNNIPENLVPYDKALFILDAATNEVLGALKEKNLFDNTLIIMTGDHGNGGVNQHLPRLYSFYDETLKVPFLVKSPKGAAVPAENLERNISNIDIAPTIAEITGNLTVKGNASIASELSGKSLYQPIPDDRYLIALNSNDIKKVDHEGFSLSHGYHRLVYSDVEGERFFDTSSDKKQLKPISVKDCAWCTQMRAFVKRNFNLNKIYRNGKPR